MGFCGEGSRHIKGWSGTHTVYLRRSYGFAEASMVMFPEAIVSCFQGLVGLPPGLLGLAVRAPFPLTLHAIHLSTTTAPRSYLLSR
jgi:hypothetical protein